MSTPHVTILTAVHNGADYIASTIECAFRQTYADWEYLIVDDASTDSTVSIVEEFQRRDPRIRLLKRNSSAGPYVAANDGIKIACGKYIVRNDADDHFPPQRIERQLRFLQDHPEYRACVSYWQAFNENGLIARSVTAIPSNSRVFRWSLLLRSQSIHSAVCYEKSLMEELGGYYPLPLSQDYRLWCDLTRRNWLGTIPEILSYVRDHGKRESYKKFEIQRELALEVLSDHMTALTGERWAREELLALRAVGHSESMPVGRGTSMLDRWDRLWQQDPELTSADRNELQRTSVMRRWKHFRTNARNQPGQVLAGLLKLVTTKPHSVVPVLKGMSI